MANNTIFFLFSAFLLLLLIPILIIRDLKKEKKLTDIFISNIMFLIVFLVSVGEVLKAFLETDTMNSFNQILFLFVIILVVAPLIFIGLFHIKDDIKKWSNPKEYKYYWMYRIRYIGLIALTFIFFGAVYKFYLIFKVVFP